MARDFDGSGDSLSIDSAVVSGTPFTLACWFNADDVTGDHALLGLTDKDVDDQLFNLQASGSSVGDPINATALAGTSAAAATTTGFSANTWHHACGVFASSTDRRAFIDGGSKGTNSTSKSPSGLDRTYIGRAMRSSPVNPSDGRIAEAAIWNVALTDAQVAELAAGFAPPLVRPDALVAYWPLIGRESPEVDRYGGFDLTVNGAVVAAHYPGIIYPAGVT